MAVPLWTLVKTYGVLGCMEDVKLAAQGKLDMRTERRVESKPDA